MDNGSGFRRALHQEAQHVIAGEARPRNLFQPPMQLMLRLAGTKSGSPM